MPRAKRIREQDPKPQPPARSRTRIWLVVLLIACAALAWASSTGGVFLLDDFVHITGNPAIRRLSPLAEVVKGSSRPLVELSLAVNHAIGGLRPFGYHVFNLLVHGLAAMVLYGVVVRSARGRGAASIRTGADSGAGGDATILALSVAGIWLLHPLQTQSVTYLIQRAESMMGLCYLLTLYGILRRGQSGAAIWSLVAILACAAGMLCKTVMVTAPVVALLLDRAVLADSWRAVFARRWGLHLGLAATWAVPVAMGAVGELIDPSSHAAGTVGFSVSSVTPWHYLLTQGGVILHYLRLSFWPRPLVFDYAWPAEVGLAAAALPCLAVLGLFAASVWLYVRRPALGLAPLAFFIILAPTSSFVPIADLCVEHRMYLPLACVIVTAVLAVRLLLARLERSGRVSSGVVAAALPVLTVAVLIALAVLTHMRNQDYQSELAMWRSVVRARPENARARSYLGDALMDAGEHDEAIAQYREALRINPNLDIVENNLANALARTGRLDEALETYERILARDPRLTHVHLNFALALQMKGRLAEAVEHYEAGLAADPRQTSARHNLGAALRGLGRLSDAEEAHRTALQDRPADPDGWFALGLVLEAQRRGGEAIAAYEQVIRLQPDHAGATGRLAVLRPNAAAPPSR